MSFISRFSTAIRNRDWGTAVIDVVVVAVGILMALAVDNWRDEREQRNTESVLLNRMHEEILHAQTENAEASNRLQNTMDALFKAREVVLDGSSDKILTEKDCFEVFFSHELPAPFDLKLSVFEEVARSGEVAIIQDAELRSAILSFIGFREQGTLRFQAWSNQMHDLPVLFPEALQYEIRPSSDPSDLDGFEPSATCSLSEMKSNPRFANALGSNLSRSGQLGRGLVSVYKNDLAEMHRKLDVRLNLSHP